MDRSATFITACGALRIAAAWKANAFYQPKSGKMRISVPSSPKRDYIVTQIKLELLKLSGIDEDRLRQHVVTIGVAVITVNLRDLQ